MVLQEKELTGLDFWVLMSFHHEQKLIIFCGTITSLRYVGHITKFVYLTKVPSNATTVYENLAEASAIKF